VVLFPAVPPPRRGVARVELGVQAFVLEEDEAVAVVGDVAAAAAEAAAMRQLDVDEAERAVDPGPRRRRRAGEEVRRRVVDVVGEEAAHRVREEVREQQPALVDEAAPRLADAPRRREAARREAAEDGREHVAGQTRRRRGLHGDPAQAQVQLDGFFDQWFTNPSRPELKPIEVDSCLVFRVLFFFQ